MIIIRNYVECDAQALWELHFNTIRQINSRHYSKAQIEAWAPSEPNILIWKKRMHSLSPFIAEINGQIVGYSDLQPDGKIDHFFCHHAWQRKGIGTALMNHVFAAGRHKGISRYYSEVSMTAKPFYEHFGFVAVSKKTVTVRGQQLTNYLMEKRVG